MGLLIVTSDQDKCISFSLDYLHEINKNIKDQLVEMKRNSQRYLDGEHYHIKAKLSFHFNCNMIQLRSLQKNCNRGLDSQFLEDVEELETDINNLLKEVF